MLSHQRLRLLHLHSHLCQSVETLLELLSGWWILGDCGHQLDCVKSCLLVEIVEQLNDLVEHIQVVDLNFTFLELGKGGQSSHCGGSDFIDIITQHLAKRWN